MRHHGSRVITGIGRSRVGATLTLLLVLAGLAALLDVGNGIGQAAAAPSADLIFCGIGPEDADYCPPTAIGTSAGTPWLLDTTGFPARWDCGTWPTGLGWLHIVSDAAIWGAYMAIPVVLGFFLMKKRTPLPLATWLFIAFIASCGIGHLIESIIFWHPVYRLAGVWKAITAVVSWATVMALIPIVPKVLRWPTLTEVNERLKDEVSTRKQAEAQVRKIVETAPVGMIMIDRDGVITLVNQEAGDVFGYDAAELLGQPIEVVVPDRFRSIHVTNRDAFFEDPTRRRMGGGRQLHGLRRDGSEVAVDIGLNPLQTSAGPCVLASVVDVTEQKHIEAELRRLNADMESKNAELEQFVYTASHDLKSPMVTMQGFASLMMEMVESGETDRLDEYAGRIADATLQMRSTIDVLLDMSRIGRASHHPVRIDVRREIATILGHLESQIEATGAEVHICDDIPDVMMDATGFTQVLQNLIGNAIKYGRPDDGPPRVTVGGSVGDDMVELFVSDTGPGVAVEHRDRVFGLFQQLHPGSDGAGVGLAIVRRIVEVHGGNVWVEPNQGPGATFRVRLPVADPASMPV